MTAPEDVRLGLVDRLVALDARVHALEAERLWLASQGFGEGATMLAGMLAPAPPKLRQVWRLAAEPGLAPDALGPYEARPDDPVILEARAAAAFARSFGLDQKVPDVAGATARLREGLAPAQEKPEISIILRPGPLPALLATLESLARQQHAPGYEILCAGPPELAALPGLRPEHNPAAARGQILVFLEPGLCGAPGWLQKLAAGLARWPQAGLLGAKIFRADGRLANAGFWLRRDASAHAFGQGDDPNRPEYCHARQVDFCAGAFAVPAELFQAAGGLDPALDALTAAADLALKLRAAGKQIWFQPQARLIAAPFAPAMPEPAATTLLRRWFGALGQKPRNAAALLPGESSRRRLLVVDMPAPSPGQNAGARQTTLALQTCLNAGYETHFLAPEDWLYQPDFFGPLQEMGVICAYAPYEIAFEIFMQRQGWRFDVILVYRAPVMVQCLPAIQQFAPQAVLLFHLADLHYLRLERAATLTGDADLAAAAALMKTRELALIVQAHATITHSTAERDILAREAPEAQVAVWPLMAPAAGTRIPFGRRRDLCFLGFFGHAPNADAALYFLREIFPLLRAAEPGLRCIIAGAYPPENLVALAAPDVLIPGWVEDARALLDSARVFVCPLRYGAGAKGKIAEALGHGLPVVATPVSLEGMALTPEEDVLVADGPADFAMQVLRLLRDEALWNRLSAKGQVFAHANFSLEAGQRHLAAAVDLGLASLLDQSA